jgi:transcription antitermination factor NusG
MSVLRTDWHIFRTAPRCEDRVREALGWRAIEAIAPRVQQFERISRRRKVLTDAPMFPGYVFAHMCGPLWPRLSTVPGLYPRPLALNGTPYRLLASDVAYIMGLQLSPPADPDAPPAPDVYRKGERVDITGGPFMSFQADVGRDNGPTVELVVMLFGRPTPYNALREWVRRAA